MELTKIIEDLAGKKIIPMPDQTAIWEQWYEGNVKDFHSYKEFNGVKKVTQHRKTLNMGKKVSEDWANLLLNEKTQVAYGSAKQNARLNALYDKVEFWTRGNEGVEKSFGLGNGAFVETFDEDGNIYFQFVNARKMYPLTIENGKITECAFANVGSDEVIIQIHERGGLVVNENETQMFTPAKEGNYCIRTTVYSRIDADNVGELKSDSWFDTQEKMPWFQHIKANISNNIDINSPLGISVFANSIDALQGVDLAYDGFCEEMRIGKSKIFINKKLVQYDEDGDRYIFDVDQTGFYYLGEGAENKPVEVYAPTLRTEQYFAGINNALNLLSSKVGFGENHYRYDQSGISTATQVISQNSEMFRTIKKHEILLYDVIVNATKVLMYINNTFTSNEKFDLNAEIKPIFDDSIIEDKESEKANDRLEVAQGLMSKVDYMIKWYGLTEEEARKKLEEIKADNSATNWFSEE